MPRILIIGATGYVGQALALSLLRSGTHTVYGVARTPEKARSLAAQEITPVIAPDFPTTPDPVLAAIEAQRIDTVVVTGADDAAAATRDAILAAGRARLAALADAGAPPAKLGLVYTSGTWLHGSSRAPVSDTVPVGFAGSGLSPHPPAELTAWRAGFEATLLADDVRAVLDVLIVRPALVYGRGAWIWAGFFKPVVEAARQQQLQEGAEVGSQAVVQVPLDAGSRPSLIHVDDVASGLHAAVDRLPLFSGTGVYPVFDLAAQSESMQDVFDALASAVGFGGKVELVGAGDNLFAKAMSTTANNRSERAKSLLGWTPKRAGFVDGMDVYASAFAATL